MAELDRIKRNVAKMASMNAPETDIDGYISSEGVTIEDVRNYQPQPEEQGLSADLSQRQANLQEIEQRYGAGEMSQASRELQTGGQYAGGVWDVVGTGIKKGLEFVEPIVPESYQRATKASLQGLGEKELVQSGLQALQTGGEKWQQWRQEYPDLIRNVEAIGNIAGFAPAGMAGKAVKTLGGEAVKGAGLIAKPLAKVAVSPVTIPYKAAKRALTGKEIDIIPAEDIGKAATKKYAEIEATGEFLPSSVKESFLKKKDFLESERISADIPTEAAEDLARLTKRYKGLESGDLTLGGAENVLQELSDKVSGSLVEGGKPTKTTKLLMELQDDLRSSIDELPEGAINREARELYKTKIKTMDILEIIEKSKMTNNAANSIRTSFKTLAFNKKKNKAYSKEEIDAMKAIGEGSAGIDLLKSTIGSRLISTMVGVSSGGLPGAVAGEVASRAARGGAEALQLQKALRLLEQIQKPAKEILKSDKAKASKPLKDKPQLLLPKPDIEYSVSPTGIVKPLSYKESANLQANRRAAADIGLTQDVTANIRRIELRKKIGKSWDKIDSNQRDTIAREIEEAWKSNPKISIKDMIFESRIKAEELAKAKGKTDIGSFGQALTEIKKKGIK